MSLRVRGLESVDPRAVPLPHGTEVMTRVDRVLENERIVPQGAVGRVVKLEGDDVDVALVGIGVVRYRRDELLPRKIGQVRYAQRRAASFDALSSCVVLEAVVGSRAWGLAEAGSDTDRRGLFALPFPWKSGLIEPPVDLVSEDGSTTYWEIDKGLRQALRADPNTLELLFVRTVRAVDPIGQWILDARDAFVSAEIHGTFARYAISQLRRLEQGHRLAEHREKVLAWLREEELDLDAVAARLAAISPRVAPTEADAAQAAKLWVKQLYRSMHDQGLLPASDFASLVRFARTEAETLELPRELRPKNAYNLLRLIEAATDWLKSGEQDFAVPSHRRERLLAIKRGEVPLTEVLAEAEALAPALEDARRATKLPPHPDVARVDLLLRRISQEIARRWIARDEGPWGTAAPEPPIAAWEDP
ncbi:MAG: DNA polymerase beta superfamily protein [Polyangiales bacterium]